MRGHESVILLIDNYDSFTYNLFHYLGEVGAEAKVVRNDQLTVDGALALEPEAIVISPGPCDPSKAGICLELIKRAAGEVPMLGVCLGHQAIGEAFGGRVVRAPRCMHGKLSAIHHDGTGIFAGIPTPFQATRYHSLTLEPATFPAALRRTAHADDQVVMGLAHPDLPIYGVQFHPESIMTEHGHALLRNFLELAKAAPRKAA
jgi:anthranilate synthase component 2